MSFKQKHSSDILTVFSIALVLILVGIYGVLSLHSTHIVNILKESVDIMVEFEPEATADETDKMIQELKSNENVLPQSVVLIDRDEAKEIMIGEMGDEYLILGMENPFRSSVLFRLRSESYSSAYLADLREQLSGRSMVSDVFYEEDFFDWLANNLKRFSFLALGLGFVLLILSTALIYNTINLSLNADRSKIQTMELVGANWNYIKKPYLKNSAIMGLIAAIGAIIFILLSVFFIGSRFPDVEGLINSQYLLIVCGLILLLGISIPFIASFIIVSRYLRKIYI